MDIRSIRLGANLGTETTLNKLYFGANLPILREEIADGSVDLIYLDPPFNSNATYNVLFREHSGKDSGANFPTTR